MKVILSEGDIKFGMDELQTHYYITIYGEQVADFKVGNDTFIFNPHAGYLDVNDEKDKDALARVTQRAFVVLNAKQRAGEHVDSNC